MPEPQITPKPTLLVVDDTEDIRVLLTAGLYMELRCGAEPVNPEQTMLVAMR